MKKEFNSQKGEIQIEAIVVVVIVIYVIFFLMNIGILVYQQENVTVTANQAAADVARTYAMPYSDPFLSYISLEYIKDRSPYRYWSFSNSKHNLDKQAKEKAKWYACYRLADSEYNQEQSGGYDNVSVEMGENDMGMRVLKVTISRKYSALILNPVKYFGLDPDYTVTAEGTAICYDAIHDMNMTAWYQELHTKGSQLTAAGRAWDSFVKAISKIMNAVK
ncbi:MAG: hypothetical protein HDR01_07650 [Lachnospiraceae bacterium]|nr:hypothetical protein [Lachnospiraceae bacterium]